MAIYKRLKVQPPTPAESNPIIDSIISTYLLVRKARRYVEVTPLPLSIEDITAVVHAHPVSIGRDVLDECIFKIDDYELDKAYRKQNSK